MKCRVTQGVFVVETCIRKESYQKGCIKFRKRVPCVKIPLKLRMYPSVNKFLKDSLLEKKRERT
jgi:hypothetical protein